VEAAGIGVLWAQIAAEVEQPVVLVVEAAGAECSAVVGDATGSVLSYLPQGYGETGSGSLHSVGDHARAARDQWEPPLTAYYFGHHSEFPRWSVVSRSDAIRALAEFCERPGEPPAAIAWELD
jgi:hypothetical protein